MAYSKNNIIDYVTHYYDQRAIPFRSLSSLSNEKAIKIMKSMYNEYNDETEFSIRFKEPIQYLNNRRETEKWVRNEFIKKGGIPNEKHPIYTVLGESKWLKKQKPKNIEEATIKLPLSIFKESDISFTYPDSMVSRWLSRNKPEELYNKFYHGKIFLMSEILAIIKQKGIPEYEWKLNLPENFPPYIEGQVWNYQPIMEYVKGL